MAKKRAALKKAGRRAPAHKNARNREEGARERILKAGRKVFALHPYRAATTRMIAEAAGVDHPLIHYHFRSKENLFERIAGDMYEEFSQANLSFFEDLPNLSPREGLSLYLDRLLRYCTKNPEPLQLLYLNMGHIGRLEELPGYRYTLMHMEQVRRTFETRIRLRASREEIERFIYCLHILVISFIGTQSCQAQVLGLKANSPAYRAWVKEALLELFLPSLEALIFPGGRPTRRTRSRRPPP